MSLRFVPNAISVARVLLVAPLVWFIVTGRYREALIVLVVAGVSDGLDGFLAKRFDWRTRLAQVLDNLLSNAIKFTRTRKRAEIDVGCESADGYTRDGCVFKDDIDIFDTMNAIVRYSNGVNMSYSVNTFMPIEGYHLAFNGTRGRLEIRDYERQAWDPPEDTEIDLIHNFGQKEKISPTGTTEGGHGGGDTRLRDLIFRKADAPAHMRLPNSRAGAMSCLTGIAARKSIDENRPIRVADLVKLT